MDESAKMTAVLVIVSLVSAASLSLVYEKAKPIIEYNNQADLEHSLTEVLPEARTFDENREETEVISKEREGIRKVFDAYNKEGDKIGVAILIDTIGFGGTIKALVGMSLPDKKITGIKILEHLETPGLGERITEPEFLNQFMDLRAKTKTYDTSHTTGATIPSKTVMAEQIDAITGATISSTAVIKAVTENVNKIASQIEESAKITAEGLITENQIAATVKEESEEPDGVLTEYRENFTN